MSVLTVLADDRAAKRWLGTLAERFERLLPGNRERTPTRRVAIACQGGGSHTAFTAGVLTRLLDRLPDRYEVAALSGTSGGAVCAVTAWYGLVSEHDPGALLEAVWDDIAASDSPDRLLNGWAVVGARLESAGLGVPAISPYRSPLSEHGRNQLREALTRHVAFEAFPDLIAGAADPPRLVIGAADVESGRFERFENAAVTAETVLASAAVPELFEAVEVDDRRYWDGLFGQNPPILDLLCGEPGGSPDELWVIRINPRRTPETPTALGDIHRRANELAGNVSLQQQLRVVDRLNRWANAGRLSEHEYTYTEVRSIELPRETAPASKIDRRADAIERLRHEGGERAAAFLDQLEYQRDRTA